MTPSSDARATPPRRLSSDELLEAGNMLRQVLPQPDAFEPEFGPNALARGVVRASSYRPGAHELNAISAGARQVGEAWCYMSLLPHSRFRLAKNSDLKFSWALPLVGDAIGLLQAADPDWHGFNPHVLFSPSGRWAVSFSEGSHAVVAGSDAVVSTVRSSLGEDGDVFGVIEDWVSYDQRFGTESKWLPSLLERVYGPGAAAMIRATGDATP